MWDHDPAEDNLDARDPGVERREYDPAGIETAQPTPGPVVIAALVHALGYPPSCTSPATPGSHWDAVCTAPPPLTNSEITTVATVIDQLGPSNFEV